jgi:hypothetical protein
MKFLKKVCPCCKEYFSPNPRNVNTQIYCHKPECRKASKKASQKRWLDKNPGHFSGFANVERVRQWRLANPGYSRRKGSGSALQDHLDQILDTKHDVIPHTPPPEQPFQPLHQALQDVDILQIPVLVGLIAHLTGSTLQDEIDLATLRLQQLGLDVISAKGGRYDPQVSNLSRPHPQYSRTVQLGGSPSGP